jgi:catechol 2,3-dioxygenase-like lactoylglutathione lyase family enzyme
VSPRLVPELICADLERSLAFYVGVLGFAVRYARPAERFAHLERDGAELMLEQPLRRDRLFPRAPLEHPYGRGASLEIDVDDVDALHAAARAEASELVLPLEERWYERDADHLGVRQFAVADPDGYVLRFSQRLGTRPR